MLNANLRRPVHHRGLLQRLAFVLPSGVFAAALILSFACEQRQPSDAAPYDAALAARREAAARRGIEWLVGRKDAMDAKWAFAIFSYLYRIVPDPALAATCRAILDERTRVPFVALPVQFHDPGLLRSPTLQLILAELRRRKWVGEPYAEPSAALEALLHRRAETFWRATGPTQQSVFLANFTELGIEPKRTLEDVVGELRETWRRGDSESLLLDVSFMFALTHVVYTASEYFTRYPDPEAFTPEIAILRRALRRYLTGPVPDHRFFLDVQGEVLSVLKLLRLREDADMRAMSERLLGLQKPDGSWGEDFGNHSYHATEVAVEALLDLPAEFRH